MELAQAFQDTNKRFPMLAQGTTGQQRAGSDVFRRLILGSKIWRYQIFRKTFRTGMVNHAARYINCRGHAFGSTYIKERARTAACDDTLFGKVVGPGGDRYIDFFRKY